MSEPIIEQIAQWIETALDGKQDPGGTVTFRTVRSKLLNVADQELINCDVLIEFSNKKTESITNTSRYEKGIFRITGFVSDLPDNTYADTYLVRIAEAISKLLLEGNSNGVACGGLAINIDCPEYMLMEEPGGADVMITCEVDYSTSLNNGFSQD